MNFDGSDPAVGYTTAAGCYFHKVDKTWKKDFFVQSEGECVSARFTELGKADPKMVFGISDAKAARAASQDGAQVCKKKWATAEEVKSVLFHEEVGAVMDTAT